MYDTPVIRASDATKSRRTPSSSARDEAMSSCRRNWRATKMSRSIETSEKRENSGSERKKSYAPWMQTTSGKMTSKRSRDVERPRAASNTESATSAVSDMCRKLAVRKREMAADAAKCWK